MIQIKSRWETAPDPDSPVRPDTLGTQAWWLVTAETVGAKKLALNYCIIPPGTGHQLHRHAHAEQVIMVLSGSGMVLGDVGPPQPVGEGDVVHIPAGDWHGFANPHGDTTMIATVYGGVGRKEDAGYELHPDPPNEIGTLGSEYLA